MMYKDIGKEVKIMSDIKIVDAVLPTELVLNASSCNCNGDGCNDDTGGCPSDGSCGQDC